MEAATKCITIISGIIADFEEGKFDTEIVECECGLNEHGINSSYCHSCGRKLEREHGR